MPTYQLKIAKSKPLRGALLMNGVGSQASTLPHDAALVQVLLKSTHRPGSLDPLYKGRIDGQAGPKIVADLTWLHPDGREERVGTEYACPKSPDAPSSCQDGVELE
jgi:hypothetical protein